METKIEDNAVRNGNERKKAYLRSYGVHVRRIKRIEAEIPEIRAMKMCPSLNNDGVPHGSSQSDLSEFASHLDEMERELREERYKRIVAYKEIIRRINCLKSKNENDVLFYRYIKGLDWWEVAEKMQYSERQVHRLHGKALVHFKIPEDVIECQ